MASGLPKPLAAGIVGAMGELRDNLCCHSRRAETDIAAYAATAGAFEMVVADAGIGVLASLRECADYAQLEDPGARSRWRSRTATPVRMRQRARVRHGPDVSGAGQT
jgi:hypothetical protein